MTEKALEVKRHPVLDVLVREDGMIFNKVRGKGQSYEWTAGSSCSNGYRAVKILGKKYHVHRIVAEVFLPNPENKPTVDHINRIRDDNRLCNLRWATHKEQNENSVTVLNRTDYGVRQCENINEYKREYAKAHRDEIRTRQRAYYQAHRAEKIEYAMKYNEAHKEEHREHNREYMRKYRKRKKLERFAM